MYVLLVLVMFISIGLLTYVGVLRYGKIVAHKFRKYVLKSILNWIR